MLREHSILSFCKHYGYFWMVSDHSETHKNFTPSKTIQKKMIHMSNV